MKKATRAILIRALEGERERVRAELAEVEAALEEVQNTMPENEKPQAVIEVTGDLPPLVPLNHGDR